ncbi:putative helicase-like protein [Trypanosoma cruzi]|uniref:Helicase-like protein, putative n=1 Tax=Trypanosoma cruzi (strain CL Brener) TaxID=353153 RepID=Q4DN12_TRYCC|nr:helicase-like protein, putative [Trypanosoma cruzi]EAN93906.1 helicase-like protein, putative [Trypanosoma cruzi]RNC55802.1 putative helicase-like protein [Trypanosoma cruzi]|eukprot:XP_815757.1 helicase-like protein [Trypanosoma cruzi strain CL Brener]
MDEPELFVISTSESEDGVGTDGENVADVSALAEDALSNLSSRHCGVGNTFIDEVLFGDRDRRSVLLPDTGARATDADSLSSFSSSDSDRSLFAQELVGEETKRLSQGPGVVEEKGTLESHEPLTSTAVLRGMTCADVRAVLEPFFRRKEAAKARFDAVQKWLAEEMAAKTTRMKKSMLERWRRLVNISNWGDGSSSRDDVLFPEALVPPAATLLGVLGPSVAKNVLPELQHLRPHQIDGIRFLWSILAEGPVGRVPAVGCILAHTMGLGKTCQVVIFLHLFLNGKRGFLGRSQRVLIVVPKSTRPGWQKEFSTWSQYFPLAHRILPIMIDERDGMKRRLDLYRSWWSEGGVLLVGYEMLLGLTKLSKEGSRVDKKGCEFTDLLICDEAHRLKSTRLQISAALRGLHPLRRLLLTGTPLQNHLQEYWAMVDFAVHKYFEKRRFQEFFINPIEASVAQEASSRVVATARMKTFALIRELRHFVQRVDSTPLRDELPPLHEYVLVIPLSGLQVRLYNRFLHLARLEQSKFNFLQAVTYANKISAHPQLLFDRDPASPLKEILSEVESSPDDDNNNNNNNEDAGDNMGKGNRGHGDRRRTSFSGPVNEGYAELFQPPADYTAAPEDGVKLYIAIRIIKAAMLRGERALFFSLSTKMLSLFEGIIAEMNRRWQQDGSLPRPIRFCRLDGNSSGAERENTLRSFNSSRGADVLLLSMKAGGVGINITSATRVILADSGFNPADDRQAIGRAYRYGQTRPVFVYRLVCYQTLEHRMFQQKVAKEWLFHTIVEEASLKRDALTGLRLQSMIQLLGRSLEVSSEVPALTDEQRDSSARLFTEDAVLAELADSIIYAESHEVYLQHDELVQYGKEEREFYEEYQKKGVFNIDSYMDGVNIGNETEQRKRQREKHQEDIGRQTKTLTALVDDVIRGRAEQDPRLRHLLRMMGITVDESGVVSVSSMQETQRRTREPIAVDGEDGSNSNDDRLIRRLQGEKVARTETIHPLRPMVLNQSDDDEDSILFEEKKKNNVSLVIDPSIYEPYKPGRNAYNAIFIDEDEV